MVVVNMIVDLELPYAEGKKGRRAVLNAIKDKLKNRNISLLDCSGEYPKSASLAIVYLSGDAVAAKRKVGEIEELIYRADSSLSFDISYELL